MRLIGNFAEEKEAYMFCNFLARRQGIRCSYEAFQDAETKKHAVSVWVENEDDFQAAHAWYERFKESPQEFFLEEEPPLAHIVPTPEEVQVPEKRKRFRIKVALRPPQPLSLTMTNFLLMLCILLFFWNGVQEVQIMDKEGPLGVQLGLTPLAQQMVFDYPHAFDVLSQVMATLPLKDIKDVKELTPEEHASIERAEAIPSWKGVYSYFVERKRGELHTSPPMFEKIRQGEIWRFITPIFMHVGLLHILFNMAWLWILGRQIEERIGQLRMLLLIVVVAVVSNFIQYLMSGPFFLGFSGVVVGMAGFIWMRQKVAPWEAYPLSRMTALFVLIFVIAMFLLEIFSFALEMFTKTQLTANIANTAHIVGGVVGMLLARLHFFARGKR